MEIVEIERLGTGYVLTYRDGENVKRHAFLRWDEVWKWIDDHTSLYDHTKITIEEILDWPPSVALGFRLRPTEALKLDDIAEARGITISLLTSRIIKAFLKEEEDTQPSGAE